MDDRPQASRSKPGWLARLALDRPELRAWALYDWANSAMFTVIVTAVFPTFYASVSAAGLTADEQRRWFGWATTLALVLAACLSPVLGALADVRPIKKKLFAAFLGIAVFATGAMFALGEGQWKLALSLFAIVNIGAAASFVFYDTLLTHVARADEVDQLSTSGYALGYLGGGLCLALCVALILLPERFGLPAADATSSDARTLPMRIGFVIVAVWWLVFSVPLFLCVPEPPVASR